MLILKYYSMIPRMPLSQFPEISYHDPEIESAYKWFRSYVKESDWNDRKIKIENYLGGIVKTSEPFSQSIDKGTLLVIQKDQIGWYLYLVHTYLYERHKYEFYQGARVLPIFKRLGSDLQFLKGIEGINKKMRELLNKRTAEADSFLFEMLTALLWIRNGWEVKIIEEGKSGKTPDFLVLKGEEQWEVECKRQKKSSDYTYKETAKRQILVSHISTILLHHNILLDITFHVELVSLRDTYLLDILKDLIDKKTKSGRLISNKEVEINLSYIDIPAIQNHLKMHFVKSHSPQHLELISGKPVDHSAFTSGFIGKMFFVGDDNANNLYIREMTNAFGVHSYCDSSDALSAKARDVRSHIYDAIGQFSSDTDAIIHIGMETFDGPEVERKRFEKMKNTMEKIQPGQNRLCWIYYHFFQSYSRSYQEWFFDETVSPATSFTNPVPPIKKTFLVINEDEITITDASHWEIDLP